MYNVTILDKPKFKEMWILNHLILSLLIKLESFKIDLQTNYKGLHDVQLQRFARIWTLKEQMVIKADVEFWRRRKIKSAIALVLQV